MNAEKHATRHTAGRTHEMAKSAITHGHAPPAGMKGDVYFAFPVALVTLEI